jgi:superfamily II DNA or RNA helicase
LHPHNHRAYQLVNLAWDEGKRAVVEHATSTGKMYILCKLVIDAIVAGESCLIIAPTNIIISNIKRILKMRAQSELITFSTYAGLNSIIASGKVFKYIFLDEFHHIGAEVWGSSVDSILDPSHNVVGFSATPYRSDGKNVFSSLDNNIVSKITLFDAIVQDILTAPKYISALYSNEEEYAEAENIILTSKNIDDDQKSLLREQLVQMDIDWRKSGGIPAIFKKHLEPTTRKLIVFYKNIEHMNETSSQVESWFVDAGIKKRSIRSFFIASDTSKTDNTRQLKEFEADSEHFCLIHSVDMLNEGYHLPDLHGVVFLRKTFSYQVFMQQLGRPMQAMSKHVPLVFDFVNNASASFAKDFVSLHKNAYDRYRNNVSSIGFSLPAEPAAALTVFDYSADFHLLIQDILDQKKSLAQELIDFIQAGGIILKSKKDKNWKNIKEIQSQIRRKKRKNLISQDKELDELLIKTHGPEFSLFFKEDSVTQTLIDFINQGGIIIKSSKDKKWQQLTGIKKHIHNGKRKKKFLIQDKELDELLIKTHGPEFSLFFKEDSVTQTLIDFINQGGQITKSVKDKKCQQIRNIKEQIKRKKRENLISQDKELDELLIKTHGPEFSLFFKEDSVSVAQTLIDFINQGGIIIKSEKDKSWKQIRNIKSQIKRKKRENLISQDKELDELLIKTHGPEFSLFYNTIKP